MEILSNAVPVLIITAAAATAWYSLVERARVKIYRPERHYMRGPGPKYRAKHGL